MKYICKKCNKTFEDSYRKRGRKFCSLECYGKSRDDGLSPYERNKRDRERDKQNPNRYYVYTYLNEEGKPYYIGCGCRYRINSPNKNVSLPPKERRLKLKQNLTKEEGERYEMYYISLYGRVEEGGILLNQTKGGGGRRGVSHTLTEESKKLISIKTKEGMKRKKL